MSAISDDEYHDLADFRFQIRRFLHFSEAAARQEDIEPRQHQALLAIKAMPPASLCTIGALADRMFLRHQSAVGLVDRMEEGGFVFRTPAPRDARQVIVSLTRHGEETLERLSVAHRTELEESGPQLSRAIQAVLRRTKKTRTNEN